MFIALKSLHLLCLLVGGAASLGGAVLMRRVMASGAAPPAIVASAMEALGKMGLAAIVVLWLTGVPLAIMTGAFAGGWAFWAKLAAATVVLVTVPSIIMLRKRMAPGKPAPAILPRLAALVRIATAAAIVLAVVAFN
jgi:hypothetical protein